MAEERATAISPLLSYAAISSALLIPVLIWPLQAFGDNGLNPASDFHTVWIITASTLLLIAVTADSILYYTPNSLWPFFATGWVLAAAMVASLALRTEPGLYLLACMFSLHAIRSGLRLWQDSASWWLWAAASRDSVAATAIFIWLTVLNMAPT